jgi:hypothetical protein
LRFLVTLCENEIAITERRLAVDDSARLETKIGRFRAPIIQRQRPDWLLRWASSARPLHNPPIFYDLSGIVTMLNKVDAGQLHGVACAQM